MGTILSVLKSKRETRDTYRCANSTSSESKFDTNCLLDGSERTQDSDIGNPSCQSKTDLGKNTPKDCKNIKIKTNRESGGQLEDDEQNVIEQMRVVGKQVFTLHKRLHICQTLSESVTGTEHTLVDLQLYLIDVEEYLKTIPDHLHQNQEYEKLKKHYKDATIACDYAVEWLQSSESSANGYNKSDEDLLINGGSNH